MKTLIINAYILTQNKQRRYIPHGFIIVKDDKIQKVSLGDPELIDFKNCSNIIDAKNLIVLPGFINAHVHLGESAFQGLFKGKYSLEDYLKVTEEITQKTDLIERGRKMIADYSLLHLIRAGTTTICGGRVVDFANKWGIRNVSGYMVMNSFKLKALSTDLEKQYNQEYKKIKKRSISYPALFIHSLNRIDLRVMLFVKKILKRFPATRLILHIAETKNQEQEIKKNFGLGSVGFLKKNNLLNKKTILIHCNWISQDDLLLVKKYQSSLVQCLSSNINIADNVLDLKEVVKNNIRVCLATDGVVTSGTFSVLKEAQRCFLYYQKKQSNGQNISQQKCLDLVTIEAAKVLGLDKIIGSIERNKKADLVFLKNNRGGIDKLLEKINGVHGVIIDGVVKMWDSQLLGINDKIITKKFNELSAHVKKCYEHFSDKR